MQFTLVRSATHGTDWPANEGYDRKGVEDALRRICQQGHVFTIVETESLSEAERGSLYINATVSRNRIRDVFGSRKEAGLNFGRQIPALLIAQREGTLPDSVYPRKDERGHFETIAAYLRSWASTENG